MGIDLSSPEGKKQAILLGVAVVVFLIAGWFLWGYLFPKGDAPVVPIDTTGQPVTPNRGTVDAPPQ
jgi:hypothetical protein